VFRLHPADNFARISFLPNTVRLKNHNRGTLYISHGRAFGMSESNAQRIWIDNELEIGLLESIRSPTNLKPLI